MTLPVSISAARGAFVGHSYDGKGRRITKDVRDAGGLGDGVWQWYCDNDSVIEVRDGGFQPTKQYVWGTRYVDEIVQVMSQMVLGLDPMDLDPDYVLTGETTYHYDSSGARGSAYTGIYTIAKRMWACQDANYNVLGVINGDGVLRERYTYTPYGKRQTFRSAGAADVGDFSPLFASEREAFGSDPYNNFPMAYGVCDVGHQGLIHDEESGLVYNRARMLNVDRCFQTRDGLEFVDGPNLYSYERLNPLLFQDSSGSQSNGVPISATFKSLTPGKCGGVMFAIDWSLGSPPTADGFIVQEVTINFNPTVCPNAQTSKPQQTSVNYQEAWPVKAGQTHTDIQPGSNGRRLLHYLSGTYSVAAEDDTFAKADGGCPSKGEAHWFGVASFVPGALPSNFHPAGNIWAGNLPATAVNSSSSFDYFDGSHFVVHELTVRWDCCHERKDTEVLHHTP